MLDVFVVEDDDPVRRMIAESLTSAGYRAHEFRTGEQATTLARSVCPSAAALDLKLSGQDGLQTFTELRVICPKIVGVLLTGHGTVPHCVRAMKSGMYHYLEKPFSPAQLVEILVSGLLEADEPTIQCGDLSSRWPTFEGIVGDSPAMRKVFRLAGRAAATDLPVLLTGETGTGKELLARAIHLRSPRSRGQFVDVNCGAIPASLFESEFFGHERGAFTDAKEARPGKFELAHDGTLFLDEIGELPRDVQVKFLRVLESSVTARVGGRTPRLTNARVLAATNVDLDSATHSGLFRSDLYHRINVLSIRMPTLRERPEDLPLLVDYFVEQLVRTNPNHVRELSDEARQALCGHRWPGNVRQLRHALQHAWTFAESTTVQVGDLPMHIGDTGLCDLEGDGHEPETLTIGNHRRTEIFERQRIADALRSQNGNRTRAAAVLGIDRRTLHTKLLKYRML